MHIRRNLGAPWLLCLAMLGGCGGGDVARLQASTGGSPPLASAGEVLPLASAGEVPPLASAGQVAPRASATKVSFYAASRFAEQATFGPTPALVAELQAKGFEKWIDDQLALPAYQIDSTPARKNGNPIPPEPYTYQKTQVQRLIMTAPDQLRARLVWSIGQFIVVSGTKPHPVGLIEWINMLNRQAFGRYGDLLVQVTTHPTMGQYLDNNQNRPKSAECPRCAPNENYARELMQLFSIGVIQLGPDGTPLRDSRGRYIETYTQTDVEQMARVLTGWQNHFDPFTTSDGFSQYYVPMEPSSWAPDRDSGEKRVLGKVFPAGQTAPKDLDDAVALLVGHQNTAPFVALRLIQHHVKSSPSPAYVGRVAAVFRNNGSGVVGDLKAVIKAVLLDAEARAGDDPAKARADDGKIREPALHRSAIFRALRCQRAPTNSTTGDYWLSAQPHWWAESVFSFYAPTDRAPGSNLLAPEQKLLIASELTDRLGQLNWIRYNQTTRTNDLSAFTSAGCSLDALIKAFTTSPKAFNDHLSQAYFRGAMPPTLRANIEQLMLNPTWDVNAPDDGALRLLQFALATPYFGVIQ